MIVLWIVLGIIGLLVIGGSVILIHDMLWYRKNGNKAKEQTGKKNPLDTMKSGGND